MPLAATEFVIAGLVLALACWEFYRVSRSLKQDREKRERDEDAD